MCSCQNIYKKIVILMLLMLVLGSSHQTFSMHSMQLTKDSQSELYSDMELNIFCCKLVPQEAHRVRLKDTNIKTIKEYTTRKLEKIITSIVKSKNRTIYQKLESKIISALEQRYKLLFTKYNQMYVEKQEKKLLTQLDKSLLKNIKIQNFENNLETVKLCPKPESVKNDMQALDQGLGLFGECDCISRSDRVLFENNLIEKAKNMNQISYLGFASGELLPDLKVLTQLIQNKKQIYAIHVADLCYEHTIEILNRMQKKAQKSNISINTNNILEQILAHNKEQIHKQKNYLHDKYILENITRFTLFIKLLSDLQGSPIDLYVHKDANAYIHFCESCKDKKANLITVMDYETDLNSDIDNLFESGLKSGGLIGKLLKIWKTKQVTQEIFIYKNYKNKETPSTCL